VLDYESRNTANLTVTASRMGARFGDDDLKLLAPVAAHITRADFSGTAITDASAPALAAMSVLANLRLADTKITDTTIAALTRLNRLRSLTVTGTKATGASLSSLRRKGVAIYAASDVQ
jgi:hypothetical protein